MSSKKKLMEKKNELKELHFEESLYLRDSMFTENHNLFYKCRQLKNPKRIHACWFFSNVINVPLMDKDPVFKIFHESDLGELLRSNVDDLLGNSSSWFRTCDYEIVNNCVFLSFFFYLNSISAFSWSSHQI